MAEASRLVALEGGDAQSAHVSRLIVSGENSLSHISLKIFVSRNASRAAVAHRAESFFVGRAEAALVNISLSQCGGNFRASKSPISASEAI